MTSRIILVIFFSIYISTPIKANDQCVFNQEVVQIYNKILDLELVQAKQLIQNTKFKNTNYSYLLLEDYIDFYQLFIYEDPDDFKNLISNKDKRIKQIQKSNLPQEWKWFLQSEINLHWSLIHLKNDENWKAYQCVKEAYQKLKSCQEKFPEFKYYKKSLGILETLLGTIPDEFDWAFKILGFEGSLTEGKKHLLEFISADKEDFFQMEASVAYSFVLTYLENNSTKGLEYWQSRIAKLNQNYLLFHVVMVKLLIKSGKMKEAKKLIETIDTERLSKVPYLIFMSGVLKLQNLESQAEKDFLKYLKIFRGSSYVKESYQKLAWIALLKGSNDDYSKYRLACIRVSYAITDEDKQALKEAKSGEKPDLLLLKARLLCDGANYNRAYNLLFKNLDRYYQGSYKLEFSYRIGRVCQMMGRNKEALIYFNDAIGFDDDKSSYLSAFALLNTAIINENHGDNSVNCQIYKELLRRRTDQYSRSLHQKVKAGILRLNCEY